MLRIDLLMRCYSPKGSSSSSFFRNRRGRRKERKEQEMYVHVYIYIYRSINIVEQRRVVCKLLPLEIERRIDGLEEMEKKRQLFCFSNLEQIQKLFDRFSKNCRSWDLWERYNSRKPPVYHSRDRSHSFGQLIHLHTRGRLARNW